MFETIVLKWAGALKLVLLTICRDSAACSSSTGSCQKKVWPQEPLFWKWSVPSLLDKHNHIVKFLVWLRNFKLTIHFLQWADYAYCLVSHLLDNLCIDIWISAKISAPR